MAKKDYYEVLGVSKNASADEIKSAYRRLAKQFHPDVFATAEEGKKKEAEQRFKEIQHAYEVLSDPQKRAAFDQYGSEDGPAMGGSGFSGGFNPFGGGFGEDIFSNIFNVFTGGGTSRRYQAGGDDIEVELNLTFQEAAFGVEKEVTFTRKERCKTCNGTGAKDSNSIKTCHTCNGTGTERVSQRTPFGIIQTTRTCSTCGGTGKIIEEKCSVCRGSGIVKNKRTISVKIPAGVDNGQMLTMRGEGGVSPAEGGASGNLVIIFRVGTHPIFIREGVNLRMELPITFLDAALGAKVEIPTLDGKINIEIPAGTQHGAMVRVKGKGIKHLKKDAYGDLYVKVLVEIPKNLSFSQRKQLKDLEDVVSKAKFEKIEEYNKKLKNL